MLQYQAVLLCGGAGSKLYPLNSSGTPKVLLPVGNQPLIVYPLRSLEEAGLRDVLVVAAGEAASQKIQNWISKQYQGKLHLQVRSVAEDSDTADALRAVADKIKDERQHFVVISGDLVTDVPLKTVLSSHFVTGAVATCLLTPTRTSPAAQTKPGYSPKGVDYIGLDPHKHRILFADGSPDVKRDVRLPLAAFKHYHSITVRSDLADQHLYIFNRSAIFEILEAKPNITSIKQHLFPYLVRRQYSRKLAADPLAPPALGGGERGGFTRRMSSALSASLPDVSFAELASGLHKRPALEEERVWWCNGYLTAPTHYSARVNTVAAYLDVNRDVVVPDVASRLLGMPPSRSENIVNESVVLGNKAILSPGCMLGQGCTVGDKSNIKRSILGRSCKIGNNVKIINSVLMDNVTVDAACQIQNSVICSGVRLQERVMLKDCQVGPDYMVPEESDLRGEELARSKRASGEQSRAVLL